MMLEGKERGGLLSMLSLLLMEVGTKMPESPGVPGTGIRPTGRRALEQKVGSSPQVRKYNYLRIGKKRLISVSPLFPKKGHFS